MTLKDCMTKIHVNDSLFVHIISLRQILLKRCNSKSVKSTLAAVLLSCIR